MNEKIFSISKAAEYLGVLPLTLRNWEKKSLIKAFRTPGGHRRFKKSELDKIVGIGEAEDALNHIVARLEEVDFRNGRQEELIKVIESLKNISEKS